jgi:hypothetical protein
VTQASGRRFVRVLRATAVVPRVAALALLAAYRGLVSPLLPPACRFIPSCSEYCADAIEHHGLARGLLLAGRRLLRCHPLAPGGFDPVA